MYVDVRASRCVGLEDDRVDARAVKIIDLGLAVIWCGEGGCLRVQKVGVGVVCIVVD